VLVVVACANVGNQMLARAKLGQQLNTRSA
jgi:hypothetical protein